MKRCVAYCRVSTKADDQLNSLNNQITHYRELFQKQGYLPADCGMLYRSEGSHEPLEGIYADEGLSATSYKRRMAFNEMLAQAKQGKFDIIYVKDISRFTRNVEDGAKLLKDLKQLKVEVFFETLNLSSMNPTHELTINLIMSMAQEESRGKSDRVKFGMRMLQKQGKIKSHPPYGYDLKNMRLVINESEAVVVRDIIEKYLCGYGTGKIARWLNAKGIPTKKMVLWSQSQIMAIVRNPLYIGKITLHKEETDDINRGTKKKIPEAEWITTEDPSVAIIDLKTFEKVQSVRENRLKLFLDRHPHNSTNTFSTLLYCDHCGSSFKRKKYKPFNKKAPSRNECNWEWVCQRNDMYGQQKCPHRSSIKEVDLQKSIVKMIKRYRENINILNQVFSTYVRLYYTYDTSDERVKCLKNELSEIESDILYTIKQRGQITKSNARDDSNPLDSALEKLVNEKVLLQQQLDQIYTYKMILEGIQANYKQFTEDLMSIDIDRLTNESIKRVIRKIKVIPLEYTDDIRQRMKKYIHPPKEHLYYRTLSYNFNFIDKDIDTLESDFRELLNRDKLDSEDNHTFKEWSESGLFKLLRSDTISTTMEEIVVLGFDPAIELENNKRDEVRLWGSGYKHET